MPEWMIEKDNKCYNSDDYWVPFTDSKALKFVFKERAEEYVKHKRLVLDGITITEHIFGEEDMTRIMGYFKYDHLPEKLAAISKPFCELAETLNRAHLDGDEKNACLRKLLEAKDCAVRAAL